MASPTAGDNQGGTGALLAFLAMGLLYVSWGSSYIGTKFGLAGFPPALLGGVRYYLAGCILFAVLVAVGYTIPRPTQWVGGFMQGVLLLGIGNGAMAFAIQWVASGMVAVGFATIPLWTALINGMVHKWPTRLEWVALLIGLGGIILLTQEGEFRSAPAGIIAVIIGAIAFSLGSVTSSHVTQPVGLMGTAVGMLSAGIFLITVSLVLGEHVETFPKLQPLLALAYLIVLPSILAFAAYGYLLKTVGPLKANSFAYTNPVVALVLGALLGGETISLQGVLAMGVIVSGLVLLNVSKGRPRAA